MTKFNREGRYIVIKRNKLTRNQQGVLEGFIESHGFDSAEVNGGLVIESDWPEHPIAWRMIEDRITGARASAAPEQQPVAWGFPDPEPAGRPFLLLVHSPDAVARPDELVPLYTHADDGEVERLRAELADALAARDKWGSNFQKAISAGSEIEQRLSDAQALLRDIYMTCNLPKMPSEHAISDISNSIKSLLSATAQPAECGYPPLSTWPQWANWCGLDATGYWVFYEREPVTSEHGRTPNGGSWGKPVAGEQQPNWAVMIYQRPAQPAEVKS